MKFGVATSSVLHAALISWGLLSLSAPDVQQIELSGVEIDFETSNESQPVQGEADAEVKETPAPKPTLKPEPEPQPEAQNIGDSKSDQKSESKEPPKEKAVEKTATAPKPESAIEKPEEVEKVAPEEEPTPATELAPVNDPITEIIDQLPDEQPVKPEPSVAEQQIAALPQSLPVPVSKPRPPKPNTAKTKDRKQPENEPAKKAQDAKESDEPSVSDIIKNNKTTEDAASGGKKKSVKEASLGTNTSSFAKRLSRREEDSLISRISRCSTGQAGQVISPDLQVTIILELNPDGSLKISPKGKAVGGTSQEKNKFTRDALRYALRCAPYDFLPSEKYETWKEIVVTFHPSKMFQ